MTGVKKDLHCPGCAEALHEVYTEASYGRVIIVDQCKKCGGVWFDRWELYFLTDDSLKALEHIDVSAFAARHPGAAMRGAHECPRCATELVKFTDPMLPKDAEIKRCAACHGLWLNRGDIGKYSSRRQRLRGEIASGLRDVPQKERVEMLRKLQKELDAKSIGYNPPAEPALDAGAMTPKELAADMGYLVLDALLGLVFKI